MLNGEMFLVEFQPLIIPGVFQSTAAHFPTDKLLTGAAEESRGMKHDWVLL